ncbi:hypothetical protein F5H01DRAFT_355953 [Linnemannia elongata]|nr:hypothetical protein F5H01DRAFT_355953 [Linnemannia elongata]
MTSKKREAVDIISLFLFPFLALAICVSSLVLCSIPCIRPVRPYCVCLSVGCSLAHCASLLSSPFEQSHCSLFTGRKCQP